jgi:hypothetical protein
MRRFRFAVLIVAATAIGAGCAFALWSGLSSSGVESVAREFTVQVAQLPPRPPSPTASPAAAPAATAAIPAPPREPSGLTEPGSGSQASVMVAKRTAPPVKTGSVVVRFDSNDPSAKAFVAEQGGRVIQASEGRLVASLPTPEGSTPEQFQAALAKRSDVLYASADEVGRLQLATYTPPTDSYMDAASPIEYHWWLDAVKAQPAWQTGVGSEATPLRGSATAFKVAVIDTGVYMTHPEMANALVGKDEFQSYSADTDSYTKDLDITPFESGDPEDAPWHGTATSGAIGAAINDLGTVGVGYNVIPVGYKVEGPVIEHGVVVDWGISTEAAASAIYDATNSGCKVINMSFGGTGTPDPMMLDAESYAHSRGVLLIAAAGNDATSSPVFPASDPYVVSVSAVATANPAATSYTLASFSNFGPKIALAAPGQSMWLPIDVDAEGAWMGRVDGTSFSAPVVAGAAAFLWRAAPALSAEQITALLESSAVDLGTPGRDDLYGHGIIDMDAAYDALIAQYPVLSKPDTMTASAEPGRHSVTATWSPVAGAEVLYSVSLDGASLGTTSSTSFSIPDVAFGNHTVAVQPTSVHNWWNSSSAISADVSVVTTEPVTSTVTLSALAPKVTYPATSLSIKGITNARSSHVVVQSSIDGRTWSATGVAWDNPFVPAPKTVSVTVKRNTYLRLAVTAPGWTNAVSNVIRVPYYAALKTPSAPSSVVHSKTFTAAETISAPTRVSASNVTFKFYRWQKSGSKNAWVLRKAVKATSYSKSGNTTTYRASLSLPKTGSYRIYASFTGGSLYTASKSAARALRVK